MSVEDKFVMDFKEIEGLCSETPEHEREIRQLFQKIMRNYIPISIDDIHTLLEWGGMAAKDFVIDQQTYLRIFRLMPISEQKRQRRVPFPIGGL
jgi:hypothetical protein